MKSYRFETFCYGPKSCALHSPRRKRTVRVRRAGWSYEEEDWVYDEMTRHRED